MSTPSYWNRDQAIELPQHLQALNRANEIRLKRAALKRKIHAGRLTVMEVIANCPWEAENMKLYELLCAQPRWGRARARKLLHCVMVKEEKRLGTLTDRQRQILIAALNVKLSGATWTRVAEATA